MSYSKPRIENLPSDLKEFWCSEAGISKIENLPSGLEIFWCHGTSISKIENLPSGLEIFDCNDELVSKIENLPSGLKKFGCCDSSISKIENLPSGLEEFCCDMINIRFIDNLTKEEYESIFGVFDLKNYNKIKLCQKVVKKWFVKRKKAAKIICNAAENWIWKPIGNDGIIGIRPRLDMRALGIC